VAAQKDAIWQRRGGAGKRTLQLKMRGRAIGVRQNVSIQPLVVAGTQNVGASP